LPDATFRRWPRDPRNTETERDHLETRSGSD
jgi:hypothetical protein